MNLLFFEVSIAQEWLAIANNIATLALTLEEVSSFRTKSWFELKVLHISIISDFIHELKHLEAT